MRWIALLVVCAGLALGFTTTATADTAVTWSGKVAPLATPWTAKVSPTDALPDYPRPQLARPSLARPQWMSLNGLWQYAPDDGKGAPPFGKVLAERVLVPYPIESVLSGVQQHSDFMFYRRVVDIPPSFTAHGQHVRLNFGAVDWEATVYVNGRQAARHVGGYTSFGVDITPYLHPHGAQEIIVAVHAPVDGANIMVGKQRLKPDGIFYTAASGIWQTVWLEPVPATSLAQLVFTPAQSLDAFTVTARVHGNDKGAVLHVTAYADGKPVGEVGGAVDQPLRLAVHVRICGARMIPSCTPSRPRSRVTASATR